MSCYARVTGYHVKPRSDGTYEWEMKIEYPGGHGRLYGGARTQRGAERQARRVLRRQERWLRRHA